MTQTSKRLDSIDAAKGIGVLLVIYGHTFRESMRAAYAWCDFCYIFVYRFHVPLLFLLSGMGYAFTAQRNRRLSAGQFLRKKARSLLLPWCSYAVLVYAVFALAQLLGPVHSLLAGSSYALVSPMRYAALMLCNENPYSFHLWYLQTLFLFIAVTGLLDHFLPPQTARRAQLALLVLTPGGYALFCQRWVWTFKGFFQQYAYFLAGVLLPREKAEQHPKVLVCTGVCGVVFLLWELLCLPSTLYAAVPTLFAVTYVNALAVIEFSLGIWAVCVLLQQHLHRLARFGRSSMLFYLYHQPFCCAVPGMLLYDKLHLPAAAVVVLCAALSLAIPYLIHRVVRLLRLQPVLQWLGLPG